MTVEPKRDPEDLSDDFVAGAMRAAFREARRRGDSILATIEALTGAAPRILLRDLADDDSPVVRPGDGDAEKTSHRYQVVGEIARGGVGVILKGRDVDLGRDVAMKVLREEYSRNPELLQRFVEEAQIGGQLQHPGIVPVYELGLQADRRPYFTMKLVKGKTLSEHLGGRRDPAEDRARMLSIFCSVCQTMAYAHARAVIHRDLKPSNVMVGAFGEVQVVDWGFAKVLAHGGTADEMRAASKPDVSVIHTVRSDSTGSESKAGSVLGTPAYMPPEQALGEVESLDERSDVFSLGAILCEILTGRPPYTGKTGNVLVEAAKVRLEDAFSRLDASDAAPELVALTRRCLSEAPAERPRDAGVLAKAVGDHLASVEERARRAETRAVKARARALMAAGLLVVALLAGGAFLWMQGERSKRIEQANLAVSRRIEEATGLRGKAEASAVEDLSGWSAALSAAERAVELARESDADEETRARAEGLLASLTEAAGSARTAAERSERDRALIAKLTELRLRASLDELATLLRGWGLDLEAPDGGERIRSSAAAREITGALDDLLLGLEGSERAPLLALLQAVDPDPWRSRLRSGAVPPEPDLEKLPIESLLLLGERQGRSGNMEAALATYRTAQGRAPGDFWVNAGLARWLTALPSPGWGEACGYWSVALVQRPRSGAVRYHLGKAMRQMGDLDGAIGHWRRALEANPEIPDLRPLLAKALVEKAKLFLTGKVLESAERTLRGALELDPELGPAHRELGRVHFERGDTQAAMSAFEEAIRLDHGDATAHGYLARVLGNLKRWEECLAAAEEAIRCEPAHLDARNDQMRALHKLARFEELLGACEAFLALRPAPDPSRRSSAYTYMGIAYQGLSRPEEAAQAFAKAGRGPDGRSGEDPRVPALAAMSALQQGRLEEVVRLSREAIRLGLRTAPVYLNLGVALRRLGRLAQAAEVLREALEQTGDLVVRHDLGLVLVFLADYQGAETQFRALLEKQPENPSALAALADILLSRGELREALVAATRAAELSSDPAVVNPEGPGTVKRFLALEPKLDALLAGEIRPADAAETLDFARLCHLKRKYGESARLWQEGLGASEARASVDDLVDAARAAARADGEPWRARALAWLREVLPRLRESRDVWRLGMLKDGRDWVGVREDAFLAELPPEEAESWRTFWKTVDEALADG